MTNDWAKQAFDQIQRESEERSKNEEALMNRENRITSRAPYLWDELCKSIQQKAAELNTYFRQNKPEYRDGALRFLEFKTVSNLEILVEKNSAPMRRLQLKFDQRFPSVNYTIGTFQNLHASPLEKSGKYVFNVLSGEVCLQEDNIVHPVSVEKAAEQLLNLVVNGGR